MIRVFRNRNLVAPVKWELLAGLGCWLCWQLLFPLVLAYVPAIRDAAGEARAAYLYQVLNMMAAFLLAYAVFFRFLERSLEPLRGRVLSALGACLQGFGLYYLLSILMAWGISLIPVQPENQNNAAIHSLLSYQPWVMSLCTIVLAPVTEELLVRGVIFAPLCKKSPLLGYAASILVFSGLHILAFIGTQPAVELLISFLQYLPAGIALGWVYQRTGSVWSSVILHAAINLIAVLLYFRPGVM